MSEQFEPAETPAEPPAEGSVELTGHPVVDEVLRTMEGLQQHPVEEQVPVFEAAHEKLREALSDAGNRPSGPQAG